MDHDREPERQVIKVVDRRRFTAEGAVRPGAGPLDEPPPRSAQRAMPNATGGREAQGFAPAGRGAPGAPPAGRGPAEAAAAHPGPRAPAPAAEPPRGRRPERGEAPASGVEFLPFIATLATNAMAALGMLPDAERQGIPRDPQMAREYIDIIAMLDERTRGNLSAEEAQTMTRLLSDLRVQYVELTRSVQPAAVAPPVPPHLR